MKYTSTERNKRIINYIQMIVIVTHKYRETKEHFSPMRFPDIVKYGVGGGGGRWWDSGQ